MKAKILIIDDEENIRFSLKNFLVNYGCEVETAENYRNAIHKIQETDFDVIFTDIILEGKSGLDFLQEVRKRGMLSPVIMITGVPDIETATESLRFGAFDYLPKPVRKDALLRIAKKALQYKALIDEKERYRINLEAIFNSVSDAIITVDKDLRMVEINEATKDICNLPQNSIGSQLHVLAKHCGKQCLEVMKHTIEKKQSLEVYNVKCNHKIRPHQVVSITTYPLQYDHKTSSGVISVIRDSTYLECAEQNTQKQPQFHTIIGNCERMQKVYTLIGELANVSTTVLITGESGTGKELVADALHYKGNRSQKPLVKVNCSALPESLLESELFGHVKGSFTGAIQDRSGRFEKAHGGTIFLDEIGDISPKTQLQLLRVLQEKEIERVGSSTPVKVDVRVIAATNQNLPEKIKRGGFREDLYYRLKVVEIHVPPLRKRRRDIPLLVSYFLNKFNRKFQREIVSVSSDVRELFMKYPWPGNVRELEHTLEHAYILCHQSIITRDHLPLTFDVHSDRNGFTVEDLEDEQEEILHALEYAGWSRAKAARLLGMSRSTLYRKIEEYHIKMRAD